MNMLGEVKTTELLQSNVSKYVVTNDQGKIAGGHTQDDYIKSLFAVW
jgi:hypothetical protein